MTVSEIIAELNRHYDQSLFTYTGKVEVADLTPADQLYLHQWVIGIFPFQIADQQIADHTVVKIDDHEIGYLILNNGRHIWGDPGFNNIANNAALGRCSHALSGIDPTIARRLFDGIDRFSNYANN